MEVFFFIVVIVILFIYITTYSNKKYESSPIVEDLENQLQILVKIITESEIVMTQSLSLINTMLIEKNKYSASDIETLKNYVVNINEFMSAAKANKASIESMLSDSQLGTMTNDLDHINETFVNQYIDCISLQAEIRAILITNSHYKEKEHKLIEQAKCIYESVLGYISILVIADYPDGADLKEKTPKYIELSLTDIANVDNDISTREVDFLNRIFSHTKSPDEYKKFYITETADNPASTQIYELLNSIQKSNEYIAHNIKIALHHLLLSMIAIDGNKDASELDKLQIYTNTIQDQSKASLTMHSEHDNQVTEKESDQESESLDDLLDQLNRLIGLDSVKHEVNNLCNLARVNEMRSQANLPTSIMSLHLVFTGNPGTGKTTVARLLSKIFRALGLLSKGHLVEVARANLVGGHVGQTALKTQEVIEKSLGGILFIDEAYSLASTSSDMDYGREAIETLLKAMEDHRENLIVIVAGYPDEMGRFIHSNPGLKSRFSKYINFTDYDADELMKIMQKIAGESSYTVEPGARNIIQEIINNLYQNKSEHFGNARAIRNLFEHIIQQHSNRIITISNPSNEDLQTITEHDVAEFFKHDIKQPVEA